MPKLWPVHYVLGVAGVALIRNWMAGGETAKSCADELFRVTKAFQERLHFEIDIPDMEVRSGYELWAETYDDLHNPLIAVEEPVIDRVLDSIPPGRALDAACGTGRYTRYLRARGHQVSAVDVSPEMIAKARSSAPDVDFKNASLEELPFEAQSFDVVTCGLALTHLPELTKAISEIGRVLKPGGHAILADHHPVAGFLGGSAIFRDREGAFRNVKSYVHPISKYIAAFKAADLEIQECFEPELTEEQIAHSAMFAIAPEAYRKGGVGMPFGLIWVLTRRQPSPK